jgi:AraC-like DNA-binding protein
MRLTSRFADTGEVFFQAGDDALSPLDVETCHRRYESARGTSDTKAFVLRGTMLLYTFNVFREPPEFVVCLDEDCVVTTFHLRSDAGIADQRYEPYLLADEESVAVQYVTRGDIRFTPPLVAEVFRMFVSPGRYREILADYGDSFRDIAERILPTSTGSVLPQPICVSPRMKVSIKEVVDYSGSHKDLARNFVRAKALELVHLQLEQLLAQREPPRRRLNEIERLRIREGGRILRVNAHRPPTVRGLATMLAINEHKLKVGFREVFDTSVYQYLVHARMERAVDLMKDPACSLEWIAGQVGYSNLAHFTRAFKRSKGVPPGKFRASLGAGVSDPSA